jgi:serine protease Do
MNQNNKSVLVILALGAVVGAIAMTQINHFVPPVMAQFKNERTGPEVKTISSISTESMAALRDMDASFASLAEFVGPSVVQIRAERASGGRDIFGNRMGAQGGIGTGVIFRSDGWIVTNDHVVADFEKVKVILRDGREFNGTVRRAEESDIAVVKIDAKDLTAASFADSSKVRPGQFSMAVGSPFDLENTVTIGHVSALSRSRTIPDARVANGGVRFYPDLIQTDAAINQGNSGGPLFDINGQVIGINSAIASLSGGSNGIGFAIPSNLARLLAETLIEKGKITRAAIGLIPTDLKEFRRKELNLDGGAVVEQVPNDSPAAKGGIKQGDVIVRVGQMPVKSQMDLRTSMYQYAPGSAVDVEVVRGTERKTLKVTLGKPEDTRQPTPTRNENGGGDEQAPRGDVPTDRIPQEFRDLFRRNQIEPETDRVPPIRQGQARLGVGVSDANAEVRRQFGIDGNRTGAVVTSVEDGSVADRLGLEPGMIIEQLGDKQIRSANDLTDAMKSLKWGDRVQIKFGKYSKGVSMSQSMDVTLR